MKKVIIFGGGSGLSQLLKGLKLFPIDITAVVSVADNGGSTGILRREMHVPAVGDITKVMLAMADTNQDIIDLMNYRFTKSKSLKTHSIKNLLLIALLEKKGSFAEALPVMEKLLDVKGTILPLTEDNVDLVGVTQDGKMVKGEEQITKCASKINEIKYNKEINVNKRVLAAVEAADLIIFSSGSLLTSITPHLISKTLVKAINKSKAKKAYVCNLFTQPGETDNFKVSDHITYLENYLGKNKINVVIANNKTISSDLALKYRTLEEKDPVILDKKTLAKRNIYLIEDKLYTIEDGVYRHDSLKTAYLIFSYLMDGEK